MLMKHWVEVPATSFYLINRLTSSLLQKLSPLYKLFHCKPNYAFLKIYGCACFSLLHPYSPNKLEFHSKVCVFIENGVNKKGYGCLVPVSDRVYTSFHVVFDEHLFPFTQKALSLTLSTSPPQCTYTPTYVLFPFLTQTLLFTNSLSTNFLTFLFVSLKLSSYYFQILYTSLTLATTTTNSFSSHTYSHSPNVDPFEIRHYQTWTPLSHRFICFIPNSTNPYNL